MKLATALTVSIVLLIAVLAIGLKAPEQMMQGLGRDSCVYSGEGDWYINSSDECLIDGEMEVSGTIHLIDTGKGSLHLTKDAYLICGGIVSTSTEVKAVAGAKIVNYGRGKN